MENRKQNTELADIFGRHREDFLKKHNLCPEQAKAYHAIVNCRTSVLGGHADRCDQCGHIRQSYNSCRNRHCPKCQFIKQVQWVDKLKANLVPVRYFHIVFTIPQCLHKTFYINQNIAYSLMFKATGEALRICAANPKYLGVQTGAVAVLHTWGQTLTYHPHIHTIVPAGGLSEDGMEWIPSGRKFFLPVKVLSQLFRGLLCRLIADAVSKNKIRLPDDLNSFDQLKDLMYAKPWVVYAKNPFDGPERVIEYLGNYTHRVAISNHRIIEEKDGKVTFRYKDYRSGQFNKQMTLDAEEFIKRFLRHVLPCGFYKIRYFGLFAQCNAKSKLYTSLSLIDTETFLPVYEGLNAGEVLQMITGKDPLRCPVCGKGRMIPAGLYPEKEKQTC
ncbi:MAG: IS91 family transposase [Bacteroidetes bacterium]|nr:IS91 family transposase [Bacteroidota bacterium]